MLCRYLHASELLAIVSLIRVEKTYTICMQAMCLTVNTFEKAHVKVF
jgi:hypothetical protein